MSYYIYTEDACDIDYASEDENFQLLDIARSHCIDELYSYLDRCINRFIIDECENLQPSRQQL